MLYHILKNKCTDFRQNIATVLDFSANMSISLLKTYVMQFNYICFIIFKCDLAHPLDTPICKNTIFQQRSWSCTTHITIIFLYLLFENWCLFLHQNMKWVKNESILVLSLSFYCKMYYNMYNCKVNAMAQ